MLPTWNIKIVLQCLYLRKQNMSRAGTGGAGMYLQLLRRMMQENFQLKNCLGGLQSEFKISLRGLVTLSLNRKAKKPKDAHAMF